MSYSVICPSRNSANLKACVQAIRDCGETSRIIAVDDGLDSVPAGVRLVQGVKPFVFAEAINLGIQAAGKDDVIICGDDTRLLTPLGFEKLAETAHSIEGLGILSPGITDACGNRNQFASKGKGLRPEPRMLCFICVYVPRKTIDLVGYMDQQFTSYGSDDSDMCLRVRRHGLTLWVNGDVVVEHGVLPSEFRSKKPMQDRNQELLSGRKIFEQKWGVAETGNW